MPKRMLFYMSARHATRKPVHIYKLSQGGGAAGQAGSREAGQPLK